MYWLARAHLQTKDFLFQKILFFQMNELLAFDHETVK
jgi:hypothetical protein